MICANYVGDYHDNRISAAEAADYIIETVSAPALHGHNHHSPHDGKPHTGGHGGGEVKQDICQVTRRLQSPVNLTALEEKIRLAAESGGDGIFRIKGVVETSEGWQAVQFDEGRMKVKPVPPPPQGARHLSCSSVSAAR